MGNDPALDEPSAATAPPAAPTDEDPLNCPLCGYDLRGLPSPRCPECGHAFDPVELRRAKDERRQWLFEHAPDGRRTRGFVLTTLLSLVSPLFWRRVNAAHAVEPRRLKRWATTWIVLTVAGLIASIVLAAGGVMWRVSAAAAAPTPVGARYVLSGTTWVPATPGVRIPAGTPTMILTRNGRLVPSPASGRRLSVDDAIGQALRDDQLVAGGALTLVALAWPLAAIAALSIFGYTLSRAGMHAGHQWRVVLYALPTAVLPPLLATLIAGLLEDQRDRGALLAVACLTSFLLTTVHLVLAHTRYLRIRHAAAQAILVQVVVVLAILATFSLFTT